MGTTEETFSENSLLEKVEIIFNTINHIFIGSISIIVTWICFKNHFLGLSIHMWLCTIGYNLLMAEGILCFYSGNTWTLIHSRQSKTTLHWILQVVGSLMGIVGAMFELVNKKSHFRTIHGITGFTATILLLISLLSGLTAIYSKTFREFLKPSINKLLHTFLGLAGFVIGMISLYYGFKYVVFFADIDLVHISEAFIIVIIIITMLGPIRSICRHLRVLLTN